MFFFKLTDNILFKKIVVLSATLIILTNILGFIFFHQDLKYHVNCLMFSGFFLSFSAMAYMYFAFIADNHYVLLIDPGFWIALGVSLFFSGISVVLCLHGYIVRHDLNLFGVRLYNIVPRILCIILYLCISMAIILFKKQSISGHSKKIDIV